MARKRRTAAEARKLILDAAERQLDAVGPAGIRLQEVAAEVGVSHPAVLHHFGSRERLVDAVLERAVKRLHDELITAFSRSVDAKRAAELLKQVFNVLGDAGHARLMAWLILSKSNKRDVPEVGADRTLLHVSHAVHALRVDAQGDNAPPLEDTSFAMMLAGLAMFGDGLAGESMRRSAGYEDDPDVDRRFREWFAKLLVGYLEGRLKLAREPDAS
jgi:AcrR family transcriptional regulator